MIPATHSYEAHYKLTGRDGKPFRESYPVVAWSDSGFPLIAGKDRLVRADHQDGFTGIGQPHGPVIAALPSGGYRIAYKQDDGTEETSPVLGWLIYADGWAEAIDADSDGWVDTVTDIDNARLIPPGTCERAPVREGAPTVESMTADLSDSQLLDQAARVGARNVECGQLREIIALGRLAEHIETTRGLTASEALDVAAHELQLADRTEVRP